MRDPILDRLCEDLAYGYARVRRHTSLRCEICGALACGINVYKTILSARDSDGQIYYQRAAVSCASHYCRSRVHLLTASPPIA